MSAPAAIVLIRPERESAEVADLATVTRESAGRLQLPLVKTFRASRGAVVGERWHSPVQFLQPNEAHELYRLLHRRRVMVVCFTSVFVRKDPSRDPAVRRSALAVGTFVEHKAAFALIRSRPSVEAVLKRFKHECNVSCDGEDDPRCLPLHVFAVQRDWSDLRRQDGRKAFAEQYGPPQSRVDSDRRRWSRADRSAYHGRDTLTVANCELAPGMHWDVASERGSTRVMTAREIWEIPRGSRGYLNVYPDAYVRPGGLSTARRVWPARQRRSRG